MAMQELTLAHTTALGQHVYVQPGNIGQGKYDFRVSHDAHGGPPVAARHSHLVCDIYEKRMAQHEATAQLIDHCIAIIAGATGVTWFPPTLVQYEYRHVQRFHQLGLENAPGFDIELFLAMFELIQIQEETNYPGGFAPTRLFQTIRDDPWNVDDIAFKTEIVVPRLLNNQRRVRDRDALIQRLREIIGK